MSDPSTHTQTTMTTQILWCHCTGGDIPASVHQAVRQAVIDSGLDSIQVPDLCGAAANHADRLKNAVTGDALIVVGCYPRAMRALLAYVGIDEIPRIRFFNQRTGDPDTLRDWLAGIDDGNPSDLTSIVFEGEDDGWIPWYPLIDRDRCKDCGQCVSFCLFGVYDQVDGMTSVVEPSNCKTNCPACARICPEAAIIFPKYGESPINGDEITDEESVRAKIRVDVDEILGDDVYAALAERRRKAARLKLRRREIEKAQTERAMHAPATGNPPS